MAEFVCSEVIGASQCAVCSAPRPPRNHQFCSTKCRAAAARRYDSKAEKKRAEHNRRRIRDGKSPRVSPLQSLTCAQCATPFLSRAVHHAFCSERCREIVARKAVDLRRGVDRSPRPCKHCGLRFIPPYGHNHRKLCSPQCARANSRAYGNKVRKRARYHGVPYEPVNRLVVFERDGWRCQVCGVRTPRALLGKRDLVSPEMDHRIPMAMGGEHSYANTQCACRDCNSRKGGHSTVGQMALFARP